MRNFLLLLLVVSCDKADKTASTDDTATADCADASSRSEAVACAAEAFLDTLSAEQREAVLYDWSDTQARTTWSNLPAVPRNGLALGDLDATARAAALSLAASSLDAAGYTTLQGVLAADDAIADVALAYGSDFYQVAIIGAPDSSGSFMFQFGGHHMAYNTSYVAGVGYPFPYHLGVTPMGSFEQAGETWDPLGTKGAAMTALFAALDADQRAEAYLEGQLFDDFVMGPDEGSGVLPVYPSGADAGGLLASSLSADQRALLEAAMRSWLDDFGAEVADPLVATYMSDDALASTKIAWADDGASGLALETAGNYLRVDGPRLWMELVTNAHGSVHLHGIVRDKTMDYGGL